MKLLNEKRFSSFLSIIFHVLLIFLLLSLSNKKVKEKKYNLIEIGFAGSIASNSPGSPSNGSVNLRHISLPANSPKIHIKRKEKAIFKIHKVIKSSAKEIKTKKVNTGNENSGKTKSSLNTEAAENLGGISGSSENGNGQNGSGLPKMGTPENENIYHVAVDQMPVPVGGIESIDTKVFYPPLAKAKNITGTVYVQAFIDENGIVRKALIIKGLGYGCNRSAIKAVEGTTFRPGLLNGVPVKVQITVPVSFGKQQ